MYYNYTYKAVPHRKKGKTTFTRGGKVIHFTERMAPETPPQPQAQARQIPLWQKDSSHVKLWR